MSTTITLDDAELEFLLREAMKQAATDLRNLADQLDDPRDRPAVARERPLV